LCRRSRWGRIGDAANLRDRPIEAVSTYYRAAKVLDEYHHLLLRDMHIWLTGTEPLRNQTAWPSSGPMTTA
jgi:hypothetical protein